MLNLMKRAGRMAVGRSHAFPNVWLYPVATLVFSAFQLSVTGYQLSVAPGSAPLTTDN